MNKYVLTDSDGKIFSIVDTPQADIEAPLIYPLPDGITDIKKYKVDTATGTFVAINPQTETKIPVPPPAPKA